ncbi:hypothetical protein Pmi06nite_21250 [Planotetraspora mira]|uniref:Uncharacterized protein n=1 Tax=Planotetraspora mira TaxID=58121 RepID=A0A8J3X9L8_9ACTN|nr:hypothetical protein Pmi06nite_21250 [Planotetraspora mira]
MHDDQSNFSRWHRTAAHPWTSVTVVRLRPMSALRSLLACDPEDNVQSGLDVTSRKEGVSGGQINIEAMVRRNLVRFQDGPAAVTEKSLPEVATVVTGGKAGESGARESED